MGHLSPVFQHFRMDEHPFIECAEDWLQHVRHRHQPYLTDFLNPRERFILSTLAQRVADVMYFFDGGHEGAEYARCLLAPDYWDPQADDFELCFLKIEGSTRFQTLKHRDYLGALLNLGIKREKIGDLLVHGDTCQLVTTREIGVFIRLHLQRVHRVSVAVTEMERDQLTPDQEEWKEETVIVASSRLDAVLAATFPLSRRKAVPLIRSGKCKVNWKVEENPATDVAPGDTLSLRGYGRLYIISREGQTRRGRTRLVIGKRR